MTWTGVSADQLDLRLLLFDRDFARPQGITAGDPADEVGDAWDDALTAAAGLGGAVIDFGGRTYYTARAQTTTGGHNTILPIPPVAATGPKAAVLLRGGGIPGLGQHWLQTAAQPVRGGIICTAAGRGVTDGRVPSVIGGPSQVDGSVALDMSNVRVGFDNFHLRLPNNPTVGGVDLSGCAQATVGSLIVDVAAADIGDIALPTHEHAWGVVMPRVQNNAVAEIGRLTVAGTYAGVQFNEHTDASDVLAAFCRVGLAPLHGFNHAARIGHAKVENCPLVLAKVDPVTGADSPTLPAYVSFGLLDIEDAGSSFPDFALVAHVTDANNLILATGDFHRVVGGVGPVSGLKMTGGARVRMRDLVASGPVYDTGTRADSAVTPNPRTDGGNWAGARGTWGVTGNALYNPAGTALASLWSNVDRPDGGDGRVGAVLPVATASGQGLTFRQADGSNFMLYQPAFGLYRLVDDVATQVSALTLVVVASDFLEIVFDSALYRIFRNGTLVHTIFDSAPAHLAARGRGVFSNTDDTSRFRNFYTV